MVNCEWVFFYCLRIYSCVGFLDPIERQKGLEELKSLLLEE